MMFPDYKLHRPYYELLKEPPDMTDEEKARLEKIKRIDPDVMRLMEKRAEQIREQVMSLEKERDAIMDFLNGEERE